MTSREVNQQYRYEEPLGESPCESSGIGETALRLTVLRPDLSRAPHSSGAPAAGVQHVQSPAIFSIGPPLPGLKQEAWEESWAPPANTWGFSAPQWRGQLPPSLSCAVGSHLPILACTSLPCSTALSHPPSSCSWRGLSKSHLTVLLKTHPGPTAQRGKDTFLRSRIKQR